MKTKISKGPDGWTITVPAYGFGQPSVHGPYATFEEARSRFKAHRPVASASPIIERVATPETYWHREIWPGVIR